MYNYFMLMGRLTEEPEVKELADGKRVMNLKLTVHRCFQNSNGEYEKDYLTIVFWDYLISFAQDNLKKGMPIMVKGRMQTTKQGIELIGERIISFNQS